MGLLLRVMDAPDQAEPHHLHPLSSCQDAAKTATREAQPRSQLLSCLTSELSQREPGDFPPLFRQTDSEFGASCERLRGNFGMKRFIKTDFSLEGFSRQCVKSASRELGPYLNSLTDTLICPPNCAAIFRGWKAGYGKLWSEGTDICRWR